MSRSELAVLYCLRDSAQLSTLPAWCRGELSTAADLIDQLRQRVGELEKGITRRGDDVIVPYFLYQEMVDCEERIAGKWMQRAEQAEAKLALAEQLLREARSYIDDSYRPYQDICSRIDAAIDASGHESLPPYKEGG